MSAAGGSDRVRHTTRLEHDEVRNVLALAERAADVDGAAPLSEHVILGLRSERAGQPPLLGPAASSGTHLVATGRDGSLAGYGHLDRADGGTAVTAEFVVDPAHRRHGLGRALAEAMISRVVDAATGAAPADRSAGGGALLCWAHGDHPSAAALAVDLGFERARLLYQLRRSLRASLPELRPSAGVSIRPFRPGEDDRMWLAVNARAFRDHPEQGGWTGDDLRVRMAQPWFDPAGFLLAVEDSTDRLLGFHWTKVHDRAGAPDAAPDGTLADPAGTHRHDPIGEVYVLGVDPDAHGLGLGRLLTLAGLHHLADRGLRRVMLYVDGSNRAALHLYQRLDFAHWSAHVQYAGPVAPVHLSFT